MKVIGFEGYWPADVAATWGVGAALTADGFVVNTATRAMISQKAFIELVRRRHATLVHAKLEVTEEDAANELLVVGVRKSWPDAVHAIADPGRLGVLATGAAKGHQYYVFGTHAAFVQYGEQTANGIIKSIAYGDAPPEEQRRMCRVGLLLSANHPELNALWCFLAESNRGRIERLCRSRLKSDEDSLERFEAFLRACNHSEGDYVLKYERGAAEGGGFDVDVAAQTLSALESVHETLEPVLQESYPFLKDVPAPRFARMEAASAELHFRVALPDRALGERLARYLELAMLGSLLRGRTPAGLDRSADFDQALGRLARPSPETTLRQIPLGSTQHESVDLPVVPAPNRRQSEPFAVFGFQSGLVNDAKRLELRLFSSAPWRVMVSAQRNDEGDPPEGVDFLRQTNNFLYRPAVFVLRRVWDDYGTENYFLLKQSFVDVRSTHTVTALPSTIAPGALLTNLNLSVNRSDAGTISIESIGLLPEVSSRSLPAATTWLDNYSALSYVFELESAMRREGEWLRAVRPRATPSVIRVLRALDELGGIASVTSVVQMVGNLYDTAVRKNNTRREAIRHPELVHLDSEDDQLMVATPVGQAYLWAYDQGCALPPRRRLTDRE